MIYLCHLEARRFLGVLKKKYYENTYRLYTKQFRRTEQSGLAYKKSSGKTDNNRPCFLFYCGNFAWGGGLRV